MVRHEAVNKISYTEEDRYDFPPVEGVERGKRRRKAPALFVWSMGGLRNSRKRK
jgi:hypothetical protein